MKRIVHEDAYGRPYISVGGYILRPRHPVTLAKIGEKVEVSGQTDPIGKSFGLITYQGNQVERWRCFHSETVETSTRGARRKENP